MATPNELHKEKINFLEDRESILKRKVTGAEKKLLDSIIEKFIDELEVSDGQIVSNGKNITLTQALEDIFENFDKTINRSLINTYIEDIGSAKVLNSKYFRTFEKDKFKFDKIKSSVDEQVNRRLGIKKDGSFKKAGFLDNFIKDTRLKNEFTELVTKGISGGVGFRELKSQVKEFVVGNPQRLGGLQANYGTFIYDTYQQIDRLSSGIYANEIGMQSFIYQGGKIADTRKFCCQREGELWTVEEAKKWRTLKFQGKSKNYNPLVDLGGYNCRHSTQYISNILAVGRRKDLELDKDGNLVPKKDASKQKLNKC